jgi:hypothetical protein
VVEAVLADLGAEDGHGGRKAPQVHPGLASQGQMTALARLLRPIGPAHVYT